MKHEPGAPLNARSSSQTCQKHPTTPCHPPESGCTNLIMLFRAVDLRTRMGPLLQRLTLLDVEANPRAPAGNRKPSSSRVL